MLVTKCDRCGRVFSYLVDAKTYNLNEQYWRYEIYFDAHPYPAEKCDLCSDCKKDLYKWIKGIKNER